MTLQSTALQKAYLETQMNKVSRSFALVAPCVDEPLSDYLQTAYLICRVADNIEDCERPLAWQKKRFAEFAHLLQTPQDAAEVLTSWGSKSWPGLTPDEAYMMGAQNGLLLWEIYAQIPEGARQSIAHWALVMAQGMEYVQDPQRPEYFGSFNGIQLPATQQDYDQYCFYVAGTVGHMITELVVWHFDIGGQTAERLINNSESCARALQKTNIVKDFANDLERNVSFLPEQWMSKVDYQPLTLQGAPTGWKHMVLDNVLCELEDSVRYVQDLPETAVGYRLACLLMMLPAYETIKLAAQKHEQLFTTDHHVKISRATMAQCLSQAQELVLDNAQIAAYGNTARIAVADALKSTTITGIEIG